MFSAGTISCTRSQHLFPVLALSSGREQGNQALTLDFDSAPWFDNCIRITSNASAYYQSDFTPGHPLQFATHGHLAHATRDSFMPPSKRALLIASPYGELQGPKNDVELMANVLEQQGFKITRCCGNEAISNNIRTKWYHLIEELQADDVAVIYYSGHGGIAQSPPVAQSQSIQTAGAKPWRYQFIVTMDFDKSGEGDFRGILDIELSQLLRATTDKTTNVTLILDCCHAGRMARQPGYGTQARAKNLPRIYHHDISLYIEQRRSQGHFMEEAHTEGNPNAVRITAAATSESAFEYTNQAGTVYGAMTEVLASAIQEGYGQNVSWRTTLMRVREAVNVNFPQQHPCVEGPEARLHFSVKRVDIERSKDFVLKVVNGVPRIEAGRIAGVHEGNIYAVIPLNPSSGSTAEKIADAVVRNVFSSYTELDLDPACKIEAIPTGGSLAMLQVEALPRWPVLLSDDLSEFRPDLDRSKYLRCVDNNQSDPPLMSIRKEVDQILLSTNLDIDIASVILKEALPSQAEFGAITNRAEHLARAQHLLSLQNGHETALQHDVLVDVGWVSNGEAREELLDQDGEGCLTEDDRIFIRLTNHGHNKVFVSVFDVNVAGTISLISASSPEGIELEAGQGYILGKEQFGERYRGLDISWPKDAPKSPGISERLVFIFSSSPADLRHLVNPAIPRSSQHGPLSTLEKLIDQIASGCERDVGTELEEGTRFTISQIPFLLKPRAVPARTLPTPDQCAEWPNPVHDQLTSEPSQRGSLGALMRLAQGVPPHVHVVNQHNEEITVVVSKYRPDRMLSGLGINASATGAGLNFSTTVFRRSSVQRLGKR
ncbi:hypothetical protein KCU71_g2205, partial [Aureobasidium melanogenum]